MNRVGVLVGSLLLSLTQRLFAMRSFSVVDNTVIKLLKVKK